MKKLLSLLTICSVLLLSSTALAHQYDIEGLKKINKIRDKDVQATLLSDIQQAYEPGNLCFENENIKIKTDLYINIDWGGGYLLNPATNNIYGNKGWGLGKMNCTAYAAGVSFEITNKTNKVMEIDLDKSMISIAGYQGRGIRGDVKKIESASVQQAPLVIFPNATQEITIFIPTGKARLITDENLLGNFIVCVNGEYVTYTCNAIINSNKLHWAVQPKQ